MPEQRRRFEQAQSLKQRLSDRVNSLREAAKLTPPDFDRETFPSMSEYQIFVLTAEGHILDHHTLTCSDDDEAKETAKVLAESTPVEIWVGLVRIFRFEPMQ